MDTPKYKLLQERYDTLTDEKARIDVLIDMAVEIRNFDVDRAAAMAIEILERSEKANYQRGIGRGINLQGSCLWLQGEYDNALAILPKAYDIARNIKDRKLEARVLNNFGNIYRDLGDLANALNYFERGLRINEELGDELAQSVNLTSISNLHYDLNDYDSALEYALKCLPIFERAHDIGRLITIYNALGNIYFKQEKINEALEYFETNLNQSEPHTAAYVMAVSGVGKVYYKMQDFVNARKYLTQALTESEEIGNAEVQIIAHFYLGRLHMDEESYRQSLTHLDAAYALADEYMRRHDVMSINEMLSVLYDKMGNVPKAFYHLKNFEQLKEEIFKQTTVNQLRNLQIRQQIELSQKEKEVAERTAYLKQQFMANMSHEIRTPVNAIVGMTRLLLGKAPKPEQMRYLQAIRLSADNLLVIINDILDLSKIEAGKIVIEQTDFTLNEVLHSVRDMLMLKAEEKHIDLWVDADPAIPQRLVGDPTRLNQILINLTGNAIKFTEKGQITIKATLYKKDAGNIWVQFDVSDTGIGISADFIEKIFDSFTQAGTDITRKYGGTGLGLTISKQLVSLMNGDISVKSELNKGTTFTVIIPFEESGIQLQKKEAAMVGEENLSRLNKAKILLVEDNEFNRMVAEDTLKEIIPHIRIDIAVNGQEAVDRVQSEQYDLVLMDIQMPVMDGLTATKIIRKLAGPAGGVNIIAMTANVLQDDVQLYLDAGMNAYVSKPFHPDELILKMSTVIEKKLIEQADNKVAETKKGPQPLPEKVTDMHFLQQFAGGNTEKMNKYIGMFLENAPRLLKNISDGLETKDLASIKIAAHSLKPQLSYMGVKEDVSHIFLIEQTASEATRYDGFPRLIATLKQVCEQAFAELKEFKNKQE